MIFCSWLAVIIRAAQSSCRRGEGGAGEQKYIEAVGGEALEEDICGKT
jgi:hypothetical protein